ncbi:hypothetical protein [Fontivita pretiosa]|uniref:dockerin type I repeat-containing protein n=1 Tax=Fontivita pretiosa TaxID=2989684 RepID=UPI003D1791EB
MSNTPIAVVDVLRRPLLLLVAVLVGWEFAASASALTTTRTENFNIDPGWLREGDPDNNPSTPHPSNYGWRDTDNTGNAVNPPGGVATANGEAGGIIGAEVPSSYGDNIGLLTPNDYLTVSGVFTILSNNQETTFGWYNSDQTPPPPGGLRPNLLGFRQIARSGTAPVGHSFQTYIVGPNGTTIRRQTAFVGDDPLAGGPPNRVVTGGVYAFTFTWDPNGGTLGLGAMTLFIDGVDSNDSTPQDHTFTTELTVAQRAALDTANLQFDRFGMAYSVYKPDGAGPETIYYDDLTYSVPVVPSQWNVDSDGNWSEVGNWTGGVPNGVSTAAHFGTITTAARIVTVDVPQTVGGISFANTNSYTIAGTSTLNFDVTVGNAELTVLSGSHTISAPVVLNDNLTINTASSGVALTGALAATGRTITKLGNGTVQLQNVRAAALKVNGGTVRVSPKVIANNPSGTSVVNSLLLTSTARLDLNNNSLIVSAGDASITSGITGLIKTALENGGNFDWLGPGIGSTQANVQNTTAGSFLYGLGVVLNDLAQVGGSGPIYTDFAGVSGLVGTEVLVKFTYFGDADLSGSIDATDYSLIDNGYVNTLSGWINGDFDYSGVIDATDYALIDNAYVNQAGPLAEALIAEHARMFGGEYLAALRAIQSGVIPEPVSPGLLLGGSFFSRRVCRRQR